MLLQVHFGTASQTVRSASYRQLLFSSVSATGRVSKGCESIFGFFRRLTRVYRMTQRNQMGLRYIQIPADRSAAIVERTSKVDTIRLSCDAAYFIPALLRDGPLGFNAASSWSTILPFPTFNECLKDNVPLFFFKRSESRDKQENARAKQLLDLFADKLSKRQNTFYGDVLVFWRRNVDEIRHQMKLTDFTLADVSRLLGSSVALGTAAPPHPVSPRGGHRSDTNGVLELGQAGSSDTVTTHHGSERCWNESATTTTKKSDTLMPPQQHGSDADAVRFGTVSGSDDTSDRVTKLDGLCELQQTQQQPHSPATSCSPAQESRSALVSSSSEKVNGGRDTLVSTQQQQLLKLIDDNDQPRDTESATTLGSGRRHRNVESASVLRTFVESIRCQLPLVTNALDDLTSTGSFDSHNRLLRLLDTDEQRYSTTALKLSNDVSKLSTLNSQLTRENEAQRQELLAAQSQARIYLEETARLAAEVSLLREEVLQLRNAGALLEEELVLYGRRSESRLGKIATSNDSVASSPGAKRALHHVKGGSGISLTDSQKMPSAFGSPVATPATLGTSPNVPLISSLGLHKASSAQSGADVDLLLPGCMNSSLLGPATSFIPQPRTNSQGRDALNQDEKSGERRCVVTQVYIPNIEQGSKDQFAQLAEGDVVTVEREDPTGWWWVTNGTPSGSGWYPFSFLQPSTQAPTSST